MTRRKIWDALLDLLSDESPEIKNAAQLSAATELKAELTQLRGATELTSYSTQLSAAAELRSATELAPNLTPLTNMTQLRGATKLRSAAELGTSRLRQLPDITPLAVSASPKLTYSAPQPAQSLPSATVLNFPAKQPVLDMRPTHISSAITTGNYSHAQQLIEELEADRGTPEMVLNRIAYVTQARRRLVDAQADGAGRHVNTRNYTLARQMLDEAAEYAGRVGIESDALIDAYVRLISAQREEHRRAAFERNADRAARMLASARETAHHAYRTVPGMQEYVDEARAMRDRGE